MKIKILTLMLLLFTLQVSISYAVSDPLWPLFYSKNHKFSDKDDIKNLNDDCSLQYQRVIDGAKYDNKIRYCIQPNRNLIALKAEPAEQKIKTKHQCKKACCACCCKTRRR